MKAIETFDVPGTNLRGVLTWVDRAQVDALTHEIEQFLEQHTEVNAASKDWPLTRAEALVRWPDAWSPPPWIPEDPEDLKRMGWFRDQISEVATAGFDRLAHLAAGETITGAEMSAFLGLPAAGSWKSVLSHPAGYSRRVNRRAPWGAERRQGVWNYSMAPEVAQLWRRSAESD